MADENEIPEEPHQEAPPPGPEPAPDEELEGDEEEYDDRPYTSADFHNVIHKQVINAVADTLTDTKMHWEVVAPFLETAREICRGDFVNAGTVQIHSVTAEGEEWKEAEEAYVEFSIADQDDGHLWFSETFWLSDIVLADPEPAHVRNTVHALERSIAKLNQWLAEHSDNAPSDGPAEESSRT